MKWKAFYVIFILFDLTLSEKHSNSFIQEQRVSCDIANIEIT